MQRLLVLLRELGVSATAAFVGVTARAFPELVQAWRTDGHAIAGHSMRHSRPYAGQPEDWQRSDMQEMIASIQQACDVRIRGLASPCHGLVDGATLHAAAAAGLRYVLNFSITVDSDRVLGPAPDGYAPLLVPSSRLHVVWDWTDRQPGWPPFSVPEAQQQWTAAIDTAARHGGCVSLIIHPWIVELNREYDLLAAVLTYARSAGLSFATFDRVAQAGCNGMEHNRATAEVE